MIGQPGAEGHLGLGHEKILLHAKAAGALRGGDARVEAATRVAAVEPEGVVDVGSKRRPAETEETYRTSAVFMELQLRP